MIEFEIDATDKGTEGHAHGTEAWNVDNTRREWFQLDPRELHDSLMKAWGVKNPPPLANWSFDTNPGGVHKMSALDNGRVVAEPGHWDWDGAQVIAQADADAQISYTREPSLIDHVVFFNKEDEVEKFKGSISLEFHQGTNTEWSRATSITEGLEVGMKVGIAGAGDVETKESFSYSTTVGESHIVSKDVNVGVSDELEIDLKPGEYALGMFGAYSSSIDARFKIYATLHGGIIFMYNKHHWLNTWDGYTVHKFWVPFSELHQIGLVHTSAEVMLVQHVGYLSDSQVGVVPLEDNTQGAIEQALKGALDAKQSERTVRNSPVSRGLGGRAFRSA